MLRFFALAVALGASATAVADLPRISLSAGIHLIQAEVANTFETRARGLMYRKTMSTSEGMLFVFPSEERLCMWMRNTYLPLSVAFIDTDGAILNIEDMQPQTDDSHCAVKPARYALEMNQGWFAKRGIRPGTKISGIEKAAGAR